MTEPRFHEQLVKALRIHEPVAWVALSPLVWEELEQEEYSCLSRGGTPEDIFAEFGEQVYTGQIPLRRDPTLRRGFVVWMRL